MVAVIHDSKNGDYPTHFGIWATELVVKLMGVEYHPTKLSGWVVWMYIMGFTGLFSEWYWDDIGNVGDLI